MSRIRILLGATPLAALLVLGCVPLQLYHDAEDGKRCTGDPKTKCSTTYIEEHPEYLLGFVEFDDLGWAWEREQGRELIRAIQEVEEDVLMVVFAHGWKHDAYTCDTNVACFRDTLARLHETELALAPARDEGKQKPRRIVGIYLGWRGDSAKGWLLRQATFYGRKATAHKVGSGAVTELIVRLKEERATRHEKARKRGEESGTRLVVVGHSFGGALMYSATSQLMMERLAVAAVREGPVRGLGDLVVLVNPAFEAARYQPLHETLHEETSLPYPDDQEPVFAVFTSVGDDATGKAFPIGRSLAVIKDKHRHVDGRPRGFQKKANKAAVGHFEAFRSHFLDAAADLAEPVKVDEGDESDCGCPFGIADLAADDAQKIRDTLDRLADEQFDKDKTVMEFPTATLRYEKGPNPTPILVVSVDNKIIRGHNDIYRPAFIDFLRYFIMLSAAY